MLPLILNSPSSSSLHPGYIGFSYWLSFAPAALKVIEEFANYDTLRDLVEVLFVVVEASMGQVDRSRKQDLIIEDPALHVHARDGALGDLKPGVRGLDQAPYRV